MKEIIVIGAGNLAWHLVAVLQRADYSVSLASRDPARVADWPVRVIGLADIPHDPFMVFLAVPDDAIGTVSAELSLQLPAHTPVIHTSGTTSVDQINGYFRRRGALWPIRSLRSGETVGEWRELPLIYYGSSRALMQVLGEVAEAMSDQTFVLDDDQRAQLHLAAVFSNNFVTWLYEISYQICSEQNIPFETILPLIKNTALSQTGSPPRLRQTGAAARRDQATMKRHLKLLTGSPEYAQLYRMMSEMIMDGLRVSNDSSGDD